MSNRKKRELIAQEIARRETAIQSSLRQAKRMISDRAANFRESAIQEHRLSGESLSFLDACMEAVCDRLGSRWIGDREYSYLGAMAAMSHLAIREPGKIKLRTKSRHRVIRHVAEHCFARYPAPEFLFSCWADLRLAPIWVHVVQGGNIRTAPGLPAEPTKKQAHIMMTTTPDSYPLGKAIRRAYVLSCGGDDRICEALYDEMPMRAHGDRLADELIRWFIANPMLDTEHYQSICHWLAAARREQPNMTMKGRTPASVLKAVQDWHDALNRERRAERELNRVNRYGFRSHEPTKASWDHPSGIRPYNGGGKKPITIHAITTLNELSNEGSEMNHCVVSYAASCAAGRCSIWSMRGQENERLVTIEVRESMIKQVRGRRNRMPNTQETAHIRRWAAENALKMAGYLST